MEVLRVLSPSPLGRSKSPAGKSPRSGGQENTPPRHPNLDANPEIKSLSLSKSDRLSVSSPKSNTALKKQDEACMDVDSLKHDDDSSVKVAVIVRSVNENEKIVRKLSDQTLSIGDRAFNFHSVFYPQSSQEEVFKSIGIPLVHNALAGYNTSVVSYGQTGTGKTYTMWGPQSAMVNCSSLDNKLGLVPRFFKLLFSEIQKNQEGLKQKQVNYQCRCSFLEIYNEQINDLLDTTQRDLQIREDNINGIHVENLSDEYVTCEEDVAQILIKGLSNRKVGGTSLNSKSSRSHVMFTFILESWSKQPSSSNFSSSKSSKITFVDLAGLDKDEFENGTRQFTKEERFVKKSLSRLGKLVNILSDAAILGKNQKISYLGSSLTYLLQDTLGGNSKVTFLCHISSDKRSKSATMSTLRFGERAKHIENKPVINEINEDDVNGLSDQIRQLKEELIRAKSSSNIPSSNFKASNARINLNLLRASLNRSLILPSIDLESDEEEEQFHEANEDDLNELCSQISNIDSLERSSITSLKDVLDNDEQEEKDSPFEKKGSNTIEEPTKCSSPRLNIKSRKSIVSSSSIGLLSVPKKDALNLRSSIQSTKLSPTETLAASIHRGLNLIEENKENHEGNGEKGENMRKSFVSLSFEHLALKCQSAEKGENENKVHKNVESSEREKELELLCAEQEAKIKHLTSLGENENKNKLEREKELEALCKEHEAKIKHLTSLVELSTQRDTQSIEYEKMDENEDCLLDKIRNGATTDEVEKERQKWMESESRWISLTEELRQDLETHRSYAEKKEIELNQEKKLTAELDDALKRALNGHSNIVEHYADLQENYGDLLEKHRRMTEGINEVKKAAMKAGKKGGKSTAAFAAALAAELSVVRIDREKEREKLKEQNRRLRVQLRDTAEAVHAAGELLVRLREAEEALARSQEKTSNTEQENQRLKKQMEKMRKKHILDMATMKNYLAESRLPEEALEPYYRPEPDTSAADSSASLGPAQDWRAAFAPSFEE